MTIRTYIIIVFFLFLGYPSSAQSINRIGVAPSIDYSGWFSKKWSGNLNSFGTFQFKDLSGYEIKNRERFYFLYTEASLSYQISNKNMVSVGNVFLRYYPVTEYFINEGRTFVQFSRASVWDSTVIRQRLRFEAINLLSDHRSSPLRHRLRYRIGIESPISEKSYFTAYVEPFITTSKIPSRRINEWWLYIGLGRRTNRRNRFEVGLFNITWRSSLNSSFNQYYLQTGWVRTL